jgi:LppX/LprAFG-like lipoprotein
MQNARLLLAPLLFALTACASAAPTPVLTAPQIAQMSADKSASINSFHFTIDLSGHAKTIDPLATLALRHAEGDVARPDRARSRIKVALSGLIIEIQALGIGDKQWLTNPLSQRWEQAPANWGYNPAMLFDKQHGIGSLLTQVRDLTRGADEAIDGKAHYRIMGNVSGAEIAPMTAYMVTGSDVSFTLWIGVDDFILRKVHITEKDGADSVATDWDIVLSAFDQPVSIEPPPQ